MYSIVFLEILFLKRINFNYVFEIFHHDLKSSVKNPVIIIVLLAIIVLPSLYALLNIAACWDIYNNTGDLDFAITNLDKGASYENINITVGDDLVNDLKDNKDFHWVFVSEKELREGVQDGKYAAGIIIPENFSSNVVSITTDDPHSASLEYIVNRKEDAMSPRLADTGAKAIYNKLNAQIVEFINVAAYGKLGDLQSALASGSSQLAGGASQLQAGSSKLSSGAGQVSSGASQVESGANQLEKAASSQPLPREVQPIVQSSIGLANSSSRLAAGSANLAGKSAELASGSSRVASGALELVAGSQLLASASTSALLSASSSLAGASDSLSSVTGLNEDQIGEYFFAPVKLDTVNLYKVDNYGSEIAAFYLVLSMWVGAILTTVMVKPGTATGTKYSPAEVYFGKMFLFIILAILQATVTIIGSFLLGFKISNIPMFLFSAYLISIIFMQIVYSVVSALGEVGKAVNIVWLVLQIQSTGGIYPVNLMNSFVQTIHPFMPMTYGITLVRESTLGLLWKNYLPALLILIVICIITLAVLILLKIYADDKAHWFEQKLKEVDLFW